LIGLLLALPVPAHASCRAMASKQVVVTVDACTTVDTTKIATKGYDGVLLEGAIDGDPAKVFVPASEKLTCGKVKPKTKVAGKLDWACCDGDPNPPCLLGTSQYLTHVAIKDTKP
jgi:hypothetical protein